MSGHSDGARADASGGTPSELEPRRLRRRLLQLALVAWAVGVVVVLGPGLDPLRDQLLTASATPLMIGAGLEVLSALSYVVIFRAVFCPQMTWRMSYRIGAAEQAANSLLPAGGAGGLALGAWALRRGGFSVEHISRRTVAFFLLTSAANVVVLIAFAVMFELGVLRGDTAPAVTYGFAGAAAAACILVLALPKLVGRRNRVPRRAGRLRALASGARRDRRRRSRRRPAPAPALRWCARGIARVAGVRHRRARRAASVPTLGFRDRLPRCR